MIKISRSNIRSAGILYAAFVIFISLSCAAAHAATQSGTAIYNSASISAANALTSTDSVTITAGSICGISTNSETPDRTATTGGFATYTIKLTNNANITDTVRLVTGAQSFSASAGATATWSLEADDADPFVTALTWNGGGIKAAQAGDYVTKVLAPGA